MRGSQFFKHNGLVLCDQLAGLFVVKVFPLITDRAVILPYSLRSFSPSLRSPLFTRQCLLQLLQLVFAVAQMARVLDSVAIGKRSKMQQAQINAYSFLCWMVDDLLLHLTSENDIPVIRFPFNGTRFHLTHWRPGLSAFGELDFDGANFGETHPVIFGQRKTRLWEREGLIAPIAVKAGIAGRLSLSNTSEECLVCLVHAPQDILQDLRVDV